MLLPRKNPLPPNILSRSATPEEIRSLEAPVGEANRGNGQHRNSVFAHEEWILVRPMQTAAILHNAEAAG